MSSSSIKEATAESEEDSNSFEDDLKLSSKPVELRKQPPHGAEKKGSDTSTSYATTTNDPSSTSATTTVVAQQKKSSQSPDLPSAAAASRPVARNEKKKRRAEYREQLQKKSSTSTTETVVASQPASQPELPSFAAAAAAAAPPVPRNKKKPRRAGFREQFLQKLRVMLDRESLNNSTVVHWSTDGGSLIIMDQIQFEEDIIPTYFDNPIVFASFQSKLYRWGFHRVSSRDPTRYEFCSPNFKRLGPNSAPAAADAAGVSSNVQVPQQQTLASLLQQVMAQSNQPVAPNPPNQADAIANIISRIQHSSQQQPLTSQQPAMNNQLNMNHHLQPFQQWQQPNPTMNLLDTALRMLAGSQTPPPQPVSNPPVSSHQMNAIQALASLCGMPSTAGTFPNTNTTPAVSQPNNMVVQSLLMLMNQVSEEDRQRRVQADALQNAIIANIGQILGQGSGGGTAATMPFRKPTGMTVSVPHNIAFQAHQGIPPPSSGTPNLQPDQMAAILQAARRMARGELEEGGVPQAEVESEDDNDGSDEGSKDDDGRPLSSRKRKGLDDDNDGPRKK